MHCVGKNKFEKFGKRINKGKRREEDILTFEKCF
jgi:hypothetical protein